MRPIFGIMKFFSKLIVSATCLLVAVSAYATPGGPKWLKDAVLYQIYPSTYMDSDGNGIGDIPGITSRLDYIKSLGVNVIWLCPVYESGWMDGGYDVIDFYKVDPRFGTNTDMVNLTTEAHKRGIRVCLDLVAGHTSDQNPWFLQSQQGSDMRYSDYYIWTDQVTDAEKELIKRREASANRASNTLGTFVEANAPRAKYFQKNFYESQPALNYGYANPDPNHPWEQAVDAPGPRAVRQEIKNIMSFWFDKGIDGFRVDLAATLVKNDDKNKTATSQLWREMRAWRDANYPECVLISEWFNPKQSLAAGFDYDFFQTRGEFVTLRNFAQAMGEESVKAEPKVFFSKAGLGSVKEWITSFSENYNATKGLGYFSYPTGNHDTPRISFAPRNSDEDIKAMMTFFLTLPGIPVIYYGDEIGMKYLPGLPNKEGSNARSGSRTPMQWEPGATAGFSSCKPEDLYLPVDTENGRLTVASEEKDPASVLNYVKAVLALRKGSAALGNDGDFEYVGDVENPYPMIYKRSAKGEAYIIAINPSGKKVQALIPAQTDGADAVTAMSFGKVSYKVTKKGDAVQLGACSAAIIKVK